uniref:L1 transposable element RRM domain-containing protein n=1 Tax=Mus spicilegus TaxID=10103 RepID=A0A8C6GHA2_MUSSI
MLPSAVSFAKSKSKSILVRLVSQTKTGFSFIPKRNKILKAVREKCQVTYKGRPIRMSPDFTTETMKTR